MNIIVCLDDNNGMMFNNRRQSRDRVLINDVIKLCKGHTLYIHEYSSTLFPDIAQTNNSLLDEAETGDYCFIENLSVSKYKDEIETIIVYRWNRVYPYDFVFDVSLSDDNWIMVSETEFEGYSHEKITKQIFKKRR